MRTCVLQVFPSELLCVGVWSGDVCHFVDTLNLGSDGVLNSWCLCMWKWHNNLYSSLSHIIGASCIIGFLFVMFVFLTYSTLLLLLSTSLPTLSRMSPKVSRTRSGERSCWPMRLYRLVAIRTRCVSR